MSFAWNIGGYLMDTVTPDSDGMVWSAAVTGWDNPDTVEAWDQLPNSTGAQEGPAYDTARDISLVIWGDGPDPDTVQRARLKFAQCFELSNVVSVTSIETVAWTCVGRRTGKLNQRHPTPRQIEIGMVIRCKDPRKYGEVQIVQLPQPAPAPGLLFPLTFPVLLGHSPSSIVVENPGYVPSPIILQFNGPQPGVFWVRNVTKNQRIGFAFALNDGDVFIVDGRNGTMLLNGTVSRRAYRTLDSKLFMLDEGFTELQFGSDSPGSGQAYIIFAPATMG